MIHKSGRIVKLFKVNVISQIAGMGIAFASLPLFLKYWGSDLYSDWLILGIVPAYVRMADMGLLTAVDNAVSMSVAAEKFHEARAVYQGFAISLLVAGVASLVICGCFLALLDVRLIFNIESMSSAESGAVFALLWLYGLLAFAASAFSPVYRAYGRYPRLLGLGVTYVLVEFISSVLILMLGGGPLLIASTMVGLRIAVFCFSYFDTKSDRRDLMKQTDSSRIVELRALVKPSAGFLLMPLGSVFYNQGMLWVAKVLLGSEASIVFSAVRTYSRIIVQFANLVGNSVWIEFSTLIATKQKEAAESLFKSSLKIVGVVLIAGGVILVIAGPAFIYRWTHGEMRVGYLAVAIFVAASIFNGVWSHLQKLPYACNLHLRSSICYSGLCFVAMCLSYMFLRPSSIMSLGGVFLVVDFVMIWACAKDCREILKS